MKKIKKALISVSDKKNLKNLLKILTKYKISFISSGGTYKEIRKLKFKCMEVSKFTGSPEILGGRVKTLHPKIHAGILSKRNNLSHKCNFWEAKKMLQEYSRGNSAFECSESGPSSSAISQFTATVFLTSIKTIVQFYEMNLKSP